MWKSWLCLCLCMFSTRWTRQNTWYCSLVVCLIFVCLILCSLCVRVFSTWTERSIMSPATWRTPTQECTHFQLIATVWVTWIFLPVLKWNVTTCRTADGRTIYPSFSSLILSMSLMVQVTIRNRSKNNHFVQCHLWSITGLIIDNNNNNNNKALVS